MTDVPGKRRPSDPFEPAASLVSRLTREHQIGDRLPSHETFIRVEQAAHVFSRFERAEKQNVAAAGRKRLARRPVRRARGTDGDALGIDAQLPLHFHGGELGRHEDPRRAVSVVAHEVRIVATDFGAGPFGMREEIKIVDSDHLRGVT